MNRLRRIRLTDEVGVWEALIGSEYHYFEAPKDTAFSELERLAIDTYLRYVEGN